MPESDIQNTPVSTVEEEPKTEKTTRSGTLEILDRAYLEIKVQEEDDVVLAIVDDEDRPRQDSLKAENVLIDERDMDALKEFFRSVNVSFVGDPWTTAEQEDFLGSLSISGYGLNEALRAGKLLLRRNKSSDTYTFEGLDEFVKKYVESHIDDDKYNQDEEETDIE